jgi:ATP-binding cassette subfamily B protein
MARARELWGNATLLCITHDVGETMNFERVLVVEAGRIVEDASPQALASRTNSQYSRLLQAEVGVRAGLWANAGWRRLSMDEGRVIEAGNPGVSPARLRKSLDSNVRSREACAPGEEVRCA